VAVDGPGSDRTLWRSGCDIQDLATQRTNETAPTMSSQNDFRVFGLLLPALLLISGGGCGRPLFDPIQGPQISRVLEGVVDPHHYRDMAFSADGKTLALPKVSGAVELWDLATEKTAILPKPRGEERGAGSLVFSKDGQYLAVSYRNGITIWEVPGMKEHVRIAHEQFGQFTAFTDGDTTLLALLIIPTDDPPVPKAWRQEVVRWDVSSGRRLSAVDFGQQLQTFEAISPDGRWAVVQVFPNECGVFDLTTRAKVFDVIAFGDFTFSADGSFLVSCAKNRLSLLDVPSGKELKHFDFIPPFDPPGHSDVLSISSDGKLLAVGGYPDSRNTSLISLVSGKVLAAVECAPPLTDCKLARLSADGRTLATLSWAVNTQDQPVPPLFKLWRLPASW
jgi:WD40 repeat protein